MNYCLVQPLVRSGFLFDFAGIDIKNLSLVARSQRVKVLHAQQLTIGDIVNRCRGMQINIIAFEYYSFIGTLALTCLIFFNGMIFEIIVSAFAVALAAADNARGDGLELD